MNRKILCYYCTKCKKATSKEKCCRRMCHVYVSPGQIRPNSEYVVKSDYKVIDKDSKYFCKECKVGMSYCRCQKHGHVNLRAHNGYYIYSNMVSELTSRKLRTTEEMNAAIAKCREFVNKDRITKCHRICPVCRKPVDTKKHCERYTKFIIDNTLIPPPSDFPIHIANGISYGGRYYCPSCRGKGNDFVCACGRTCTYRWFETAHKMAYVFIPDLRDFETTEKLKKDVEDDEDDEEAGDNAGDNAN